VHMKKRTTFPLSKIFLYFFLPILFLLTGCERPDPNVETSSQTGEQLSPPTPEIETNASGNPIPPTPELQQSNISGTPLPTYKGIPTPDPPHPVADDADGFLIHTVTAGETLGYIAQQYGTNLDELLSINQLEQADLLFVGQDLRIPTDVKLFSPSFKIIPDSEIVYGPAAIGFDVQAFAEGYNGRFLSHTEEVENQTLSGPEIVTLVANRFSVNPRLLLALLEYRAGWITQSGVGDENYPLGYVNENAAGLYSQLSWAANQINWGYYGRFEGNLYSFSISDNTRIAYAADINHGTAGIQRVLGVHTNATYESWQQDVSETGFFATFNQLFGNPFAYTVDPLLPQDLTQPPLQLPWASNETWYFTGGPHGGWASGSGWAALDFAPASEQLGCVQSDAWVRAVSDGLVTRSEFGAVVIDTDGDGYAGTGWAIIYMHLETRDRIPVGTWVQTGDPLGHPSCEGGFSTGTHLHIARTFNGRWISADGSIPFDLGGWVSQGAGNEYDGYLVRGGVTKEACVCREELNAIPGGAQ
jgi:LasA protease